MDVLTPVFTEDLFSSATNQGLQMETLANQSLGNGINKYMEEDFKGAAQEFKRAFGLAPFSDYSVDAARYLAMAYLKMDDTDKAIDAYKQGLELHPGRDDLQLALGNLLLGEGRHGEAIEAYEEAVRIWDDASNRFSLGQGYFHSGRYADAETQFEKVIQMNPEGQNGYFGLGQAYAAQKKYPQAIEQFERAIQKNKEFYDAYAEMGYTYADAGNLTEAEEIKDLLEYKEPGLADTLGKYINKVTDPKIMFAWTSGTFQFYLPPKTEVSALSDYLANADSSQSFSMVFQFNKDMDRESVENPLNWTIKRSQGHGPANDYNYGLGIADTEVRISPYPTDVYYDEKYFSATVRFTIRQNAAADGTIDPSHIEFGFNGLDADGNTMHPKYDQFMGFSGHI